MPAEFEVQAKKFTDKIIELCATDVAIIDEPKTDAHCHGLTQDAMRATLIAIRNNTILLEDVIERAAGHKPVCRREPVDS